MYLLKPYRALTREEEAELLSKAQTGDVKARNAIVEAFAPFVAGVAARFVPSKNSKQSGSGHAYEDLVQEGMFALFEAIGKFDSSYNIRFLTYAKPWVYAYIRRVRFRKEEVLCLDELAHDLGSERENGETRKNRIPDESPDLDEVYGKMQRDLQLRAALGKLKKKFGPMGWDILEHRLLDGNMTLEELGARYKVSRESVRNAEKRIRALLSRYLDVFRLSA